MKYRDNQPTPALTENKKERRADLSDVVDIATIVEMSNRIGRLDALATYAWDDLGKTATAMRTDITRLADLMKKIFPNGEEYTGGKGGDTQ